ncbi:MAG: CapA family protein [Coriobacteriales bacterium]|nr:CapA family protein [Coriobacteriales bacterium]
MPVVVVACIVALLAVVGLGCALTRLLRPSASTNAAGSSETAQEGAASQSGAAKAATKVSFCAVGDNLINEGGDYTADLLGLADSWAGTTGDGTYDFSPLYAQLKDTISSYDIALVNQETTLGGSSEFDYQGYPSYNTPDSCAQAVADAGFDVVNCNTNHTYDTGVASIEHSQGVWAQQKGVSVIGSYTSQEDRNNIRVLERNGMSIAFLSYCYGQNGYEQSDLPNDYYAVPFDKDKMREEVTRAKELADAVVVYMHWGEENTHDLSDQQKDYASFLAGLDVDLIVGSHAHVIQPVQYVATGIRTTDGSGADANNGVLCVYGLGDFVSGYTLPKTILSGMFTCDFVRDDKGEVSVSNPVWHGLVEHNAGDVDTVYPLTAYTAELAAQNTLLARVGENETYSTSDPLEWARETTRTVVGDAIPVEV